MLQRKHNERLLRVITRGNCKHRVCFPPCCLPANTRPRGKVSRENYGLSIVHEVAINAADLVNNFVYYGQTDRALEARVKEHKRAVQVGDNNSKVAQHANQFVHSIDFDHATLNCRQGSKFSRETFPRGLVFTGRQQGGKRTY